MDALTSLRVFREVVEAGSFVKAAERLDMSTAMTSKHVANLERQLRVRLLNRTTRHLSLTEAGSVYFEQCSEALDILQAAEAAVGAQTAQPQGVLKVTAPGWFANPTFAELVVAYQARYPGVLVDLRLENRFVDLVEEGYDMALRATSDPSPSLIVRPLCRMPFLLAGARGYLERHGQPRHPDDLARHRLVLPTYTNIESVTLTGPDGAFTVKHQAVLKTNDTAMALQLVRAGLGLAYFPAWIAEPEFASETLLRVLPDYSAFAPSVYAVYTSRKFMTSKVRTFIDFLSDALSDRLPY
ncbi:MULTISPECIES: LysR family transcriptional regulator [unclassified Caballeronia]|uniref:LysR family transcriptional regulator n=1 Tax=unclassified Caballeronia TaxID=2646786 RepID=UPI0028675FFE|nr:MULTISPECIES: LysR family transcriptional regulator [unclassified Caballeronia]MDR5813086.1 LysR family transcriptional regulator [Caballeronia sp. LZ033]MDR5819918.1 LysR family transcriptional regulator [Caballeronia sp. LZ043]